MLPLPPLPLPSLRYILLELIPSAWKTLLAVPETGPSISVLVHSGCYNKHTIDWVAYTLEIYFSVLEARKVQVKRPADSVSGEGPLSCMQTEVCLLCPHMGERESISLMSLL